MRFLYVFSFCILFMMGVSTVHAQNSGSSLPQVETQSAAEAKKENVFSKASDTQIEEAQKYYRQCKNNDAMSARKDCKCAATAYLETRLKLGDTASVEQIIAENVNSCLQDEDKAVKGEFDRSKVEVTEKQREEAEGIYQHCKTSPRLNRDTDCECLAANYLEERIKRGPIVGQDVIMYGILNYGTCKSVVNSTGIEYSSCMSGSGYNLKNLDQKKYCECYARTWAKALERHTGKLGPGTKNSMRLMARKTCQKEAAM